MKTKEEVDRNHVFHGDLDHVYVSSGGNSLSTFLLFSYFFSKPVNINLFEEEKNNLLIKAVENYLNILIFSYFFSKPIKHELFISRGKN